jgi:hypothetical protein
MPEERLSNGMPSAAAAVGHPLLNRENRAKFFHQGRARLLKVIFIKYLWSGSDTDLTPPQGGFDAVLTPKAALDAM